MRNIIATYFDHAGDVLKNNAGRHSRTMTLHALDSLQTDYYGARTCEVWDNTTGTLHAVLRRNVSGMAVSILYKRDPVKFQFGTKGTVKP